MQIDFITVILSSLRVVIRNAGHWTLTCLVGESYIIMVTGRVDLWFTNKKTKGYKIWIIQTKYCYVYHDMKHVYGLWVWWTCTNYESNKHNYGQWLKVSAQNILHPDQSNGDQHVWSNIELMKTVILSCTLCMHFSIPFISRIKTAQEEMFGFS